MERLYKHGFWIKVIAVITMVIDHIGVMFFPHLLILRIIGRLSFPLFGYLVSEGFDRTHNKKTYLLRMFLFFLISQVPYSLSFHDGQLNIFITLFIGLLIIWISKNISLDKFKKIIFSFFLLFTAFILPIDYGVAGVLCIVIFNTYKNSFKKLFFAQCVLWTLYIAMRFISTKFGSGTFIYPDNGIQIMAPLAVIGIWLSHKLYSDKDRWNISLTGKKIIQYGFYIFYPAHLLLLYWISIVIK